MISPARLRLTLLALTLLTIGGFSSAASATGWWRNGPGKCRAYDVPVEVAGVADATIYGELCLPPGPPPDTVQFLVHGSTFNHHYWDWPLNPERYSHARAALQNGYATFNIDRLGVGNSTKPLGQLVTVDAVTETLHQIAVKLKAGQIGNHAFDKIVYFGSSFSTAYGWVLASLHPGDIDAFVLTGLLHFTRPGWVDLVMQYHLDRACEAPRFENEVPDCLYVTTTPFKRHTMFYHGPNVTPAVLLADELLKDVIPEPLLWESAPLVFAPPPETSPSRAITVPTLIALGQYDQTACGPDGFVCTEENVRNFEAPYYTTEVLDIHIVPNTGHALPLHKSGEQSTAFIHQWLEENL